MWAIKLEALFESTGLWEDVFETGKDDERLASWKKLTEQALSIIILTVCQYNYAVCAVKYMKSRILEYSRRSRKGDWFKHGSKQNKNEKGGTINDYITKIQCLTTELAGLGKMFSDCEVIRHFFQ